MWWYVAAVAVAAASNYMSGQNTKSSYYSRARATREYGQTNARNTELAGLRTSQMQLMSSSFNAGMQWAVGGMEAKSIWDRATYNAMAVTYTSEYNAAMKDREAAEIWQRADLDMELLHLARERERGDITVAYAHNGIELDSMSTPAQALLDSQTSEELDKLIVRFNADSSAGKALDAAALSRWEGKTSRQQILWEGNVNSQITLMNAGVRRSSTLMQGSLDAAMSRWNAYTNADSLLYQAYYDASQQEAAGDAAAADGLFGGIGTIAGGILGKS